MSEIEQLRKEINELRERVAVLERAPKVQHKVGPNTPWPNQQLPSDYWTSPSRPPFDITCGVVS